MAAVLDGVPFRIDPKSVSWPYSIKMATHKTLGGKVFQLYGVSLGDLVIEGEFGNGGLVNGFTSTGPAAQKAFFDRITKIIDSQIPVNPLSNPKPVLFEWPLRQWSFWCFIKSIVQMDAPTAILARNNIINPSYQLTLFIQEDNGDVIKLAKEDAATQFINRLTAGLGWKKSEYNGPETFDAVTAANNGNTVLQNIFTNAPTGGPTLPTQSPSLQQTLSPGSTPVGGTGQ